MGAVFPNGIKNFKTHVNFTEDVDAADINAIQDEIQALEQVVGALATQYQELEADISIIDAEDTTQDAAIRRNTQEWQSLKDRLDHLQQGKNFFVHEAKANNITVPKFAKSNINKKPWAIKFPKPATSQDPFKMWNGWGFTLPVSGFWAIQGHIHYVLPVSAGSANKGTYIGAIGINDTWTRGMDKRKIYDFDSDDNTMNLNPHVLGWFPRGVKILLRTSHCAGRDQVASDVYLTGFRLATDQGVGR